MIAEIWVRIACVKGKTTVLMTSSALCAVVLKHTTCLCSMSAKKTKCECAEIFKQLILYGPKTADAACRSLAMCKQNGLCVSWHRCSPPLRSTCTTPSCKWGTHTSISFLSCSFLLPLLLLCLVCSVILATDGHWLNSPLCNGSTAYPSIIAITAATEFTRIVAAAIKPSLTMILEMGCITLTLQCCPNPRCPARLPLKLMGTPITYLRTTGWIRDHILALGKALRVIMFFFCVFWKSINTL